MIVSAPPVTARAAALARLTGLSEALLAWLDGPSADDDRACSAAGGTRRRFAAPAPAWAAFEPPTYRRRRLRIDGLDPPR